MVQIGQIPIIDQKTLPKSFLMREGNQVWLTKKMEQEMVDWVLRSIPINKPGEITFFHKPPGAILEKNLEEKIWGGEKICLFLRAFIQSNQYFCPKPLESTLLFYPIKCRIFPLLSHPSKKTQMECIQNIHLFAIKQQI